MFKKIGLMLAGLVTLAGVATATLASTPAPNFSATFDGTPSAPSTVPELIGWDVQVHSRDSGTWYNPESLLAQHGTDCSPAPATHLVDEYSESVFQCRDHFMTALNAGGYGLIYVTPPQLINFANGGVVQFDLSTLRMSTRDWVDIWITPYNDNLTMPFDQGDVDLQGVPRRAVHVTMSAFNGQSTFRCNVVNNWVEDEVPSNWWETLTHSSATIRDTFKLEISPTHLKLTSPTMLYGDGSPWTGCDTAISNLGWTSGIVQLGHHSYNPTKDNSGEPATWHWDNVSISPSIPFTIINADRRYVDSSTQVVTFNSPAPTGASLRFSANGSAIQYSLDNGATWLNAVKQASETDVDRFKGYQTNIPAGTQSVRIRGNNTFNGPFFAQDFFIWSLTTGSPTVTNTPTNTAVATATNTNTPIPTATNTPTSTPTSIPTSTPTPVKRACVETIKWGNTTISNVNYGNLTMAECQAKVN